MLPWPIFMCKPKTWNKKLNSRINSKNWLFNRAFDKGNLRWCQWQMENGRSGKDGKFVTNYFDMVSFSNLSCLQHYYKTGGPK